MPRYLQISSLRARSLIWIGFNVESKVLDLISEARVKGYDQKVLSRVQQMEDWLSKLLSSEVPRQLYDDIAREVLIALSNVVDKTSPFLQQMIIIIRLMEVVIQPRLRIIDTDILYSTTMQPYIYTSLHNLSGLEKLVISFHKEINTEEFHRYLVKSISAMKKLKSLEIDYPYTNSILQTIGDHCQAMQYLDLSRLKTVTDLSILHLRKCVNLRVLLLCGTSVTAEGMAHLIAGLPKLQDIGYWNKLEPTIKCLKQKFYDSSPFDIRQVRLSNLSSEIIRVLVEIFPKIEFIDWSFCNEQNSVWSILSSLNNLKALMLQDCTLSGYYFKQLIEVAGSNITVLHLQEVEDIDSQTLVDISQYCSELERLELVGCTFKNDLFPHHVRSTVQPFMNLKYLIWNIVGAINQLKFILYRAINIKSIFFSNSIDCTYSLIGNLLTKNPMRELECLWAVFNSDMYLTTIILLIARCPNLKLIEICNGRIQVNLLEALNGLIESNNFDLVIKTVYDY